MTYKTSTLTLSKMKILAVDPGYERLGIAVMEDNNLLFSDCIQTPKEDDFSKRLLHLGNEFKKIIEEYSPSRFAIEKLFFSKNTKTAMKVSEVKGMLIYIAESMGVEVFEYAPSEIKVAVTGHGQSDKKQMALMVEKLIKIDKDIKFDDEYDAIAVGLTCCAIER